MNYHAKVIMCIVLCQLQRASETCERQVTPSCINESMLTNGLTRTHVFATKTFKLGKLFKLVDP